MKHAHNVAVLMYHHVTDQPGSLAVTAHQFESQIRGLAEHGWHTLRADEFAGYLAGEPIPAKSVLLTFDDGYLDNWVYAHPVLERYRKHAVLFAISGLIGHGPARAHAGASTSALPSCPSHHEAKTMMFGDQRDRVMLRWSEIHAMREADTFEIHSHTHTHVRWDLQYPDPVDQSTRMDADLRASNACLEENLGARTRHLCWPQGYFNADYVAIAQRNGFDHLYTTDARGQNMLGNDPAYIYRFAVRNRPWPWLRQRLWLATHPTLGPWYNHWKSRSDARKR